MFSKQKQKKQENLKEMGFFVFKKVMNFILLKEL